MYVGNTFFKMLAKYPESDMANICSNLILIAGSEYFKQQYKIWHIPTFGQAGCIIMDTLSKKAQSHITPHTVDNCRERGGG